MTSTGMFDEPRSKRRRLATELCRARDQAGVSGRELARRMGISQSKVSRIESGATVPSLPEVTAWAAAVEVTAETRSRLLALAEAAFVEVHTWRALLRDRAHLQDDIARREAEAHRIRTFQPSIVPGLLQTADYAFGVFSTSQLPYSSDDVAAAVAGRLKRQAALHQGGRFEFLITESALRWRPGPRHLLVAQWEKIAELSAHESISIGLVTLEAEALTAIPHGFVIYDGDTDDAYVTVETIHAKVEVNNPADVALYEEQWLLLNRMAVFGEATRDFLATLVANLRRTTR